jgi:hypothetical protein
MNWKRNGLYLFTLVVLGAISGTGVGLEGRPRAITQCSWGGHAFSLYDYPQSTTIGHYGDLKITGRMWSGSADSGAVFTFSRSGHAVFQKRVNDLFNPNGWIGVSDDAMSFVLNTSNGGAAGGWSVSIFRVEKDGRVHDLSPLIQSVEKDFSSRHYCKTRGNNYEAMQWRKNDELLIAASVYGTSDCGADMGFTEGYLLQVTTGKILSRMSEKEMLELPYVCTYNVWQAGDPQP